MPSIGIDHITTAVSIYNYVRFNQRKSCETAVNDFGDDPR